MVAEQAFDLFDQRRSQAIRARRSQLVLGAEAICLRFPHVRCP